MSSIGALGVALAFFPVLAVTSGDDPRKISKNARNVTQPVHVFFTILIAITCLFFIFKKNAWKASGKVKFMQKHPQTSDNMRHDTASDQTSGLHAGNSEKMSLLQIVIFSCGAILWLTVTITLSVHTLYKVGYCDVLSTISASVYLVAIAIQTIFLIKYDCAILPNHWFFHYTIALMVADKVWVWISVTLEGLVEVSSQNDASACPGCPASFASQTISNNSTESLFEKVIETSLAFLEPFFIEFLTISMGILMHLWTLTRSEHQLDVTSEDMDEVRNAEGFDETNYAYTHTQSSESCHMYGDSDNSSLLGAEANHVTNRWYNDESIQTFAFTLFSIAVALGFLIADLSLYMEYFPSKSFLPNNTTGLFRAIQSMVYLPMISGIVAMYKIYKTNISYSTKFTSSSYLLLFGAAVNFVWFFLRLISAINVLKYKVEDQDGRHEAVIIIMYSVGCTLQNWLQTQFLLAAQNVHQTGQPNSKLTRFTLIYLAMINISQWIQLATARLPVLQKPPSIVNPVLSKCFGEVTTKIFVFLLYPIFELYRFHSAVVAYEILKG